VNNDAGLVAGDLFFEIGRPNLALLLGPDAADYGARLARDRAEALAEGVV